MEPFHYFHKQTHNHRHRSRHAFRNYVQIINTNSSKYGLFSVEHKALLDWNESLEEHPGDVLKEPKTEVIVSPQISFSPELYRLRQLHKFLYTIALIPSIY